MIRLWQAVAFVLAGASAAGQTGATAPAAAYPNMALVEQYLRGIVRAKEVQGAGA